MMNIVSTVRAFDVVNRLCKGWWYEGTMEMFAEGSRIEELVLGIRVVPVANE